MATLQDTDPVVRIRSLLSSNWNNANTTYSADPRFTTGWWDWGREEPLVTVTNPMVTPLNSGDGQTGYNYMTGDGRVGQRNAGMCLVNGWGGTYDTDALASEDTDGSRLSPKQLAWEFAKEIRRILLANAAGTTLADGSTEFSFLSPGQRRQIVDNDPDEQHPVLFRYEVTTRFGFAEES